MAEAPVHIAPVRLDALRIEEVGMEALPVIRPMNRLIFDEERVINTFERDDLLMLMAYLGETPVGFKVGYRQNQRTFYSAKGGVLPTHRRRGIARVLLDDMLQRVRQRGYRTFAFDTFPNRHPGMAIMALASGFRLARADFNPTYKDYRLRFEKRIG